MSAVTEDAVETLALQTFARLGYECLHGPDIAPDEPATERATYGDVVLKGRLEEALRRLNPDVPQATINEALRIITIPDAPSLLQNNRRFHRYLREGLEVEVSTKGGEVKGERLRLVDFDNAEENDWVALNQFTVVEGQHNRRPDVVVFVNGLPLAVIELKNAADPDATVQDAFQQLQTYKAQIPSLFVFNELLIISDGIDARVGTITATWERFAPWRTIIGDKSAPPTHLQLSILLHGVFDRGRFLDLVRNFVVFEEDRCDRPLRSERSAASRSAAEKFVR